jgi:iron-sulfur cluster assembly protein
MAVDDNAEELDQRYEIDGIPFVIDAVSLKYVKGSVLDHTGGISGAFRFDNPQATRACGCGSSFSVEDASALGLDTTRYGGCSACPSSK